MFHLSFGTETVICEIHEACPVIGRYIMLPRTNMVPDCPHHRMIQFREILHRKTRLSKELPDRRCGYAGKEFTLRIRPSISFRTAYIQWSGSYQCKQFMLIDRQILLFFVVLPEIHTKPVGEAFVDPPNCFAVDPLGQCSPSAS